MKKVRKHLLAIFYFPLVFLTFILVFWAIFSLFNNSGELAADLSIHGDFVPGELQAYFNGQKVAALSAPLMADTAVLPQVLSASTGEKWIDINLSSQTLSAFESDGRIFMSVPISSGLWGRTPTGTFRIWVKLRYTLMSGGSQALGTYYYLPNVPCTQYFYKGYGLHGTYWHNNFGHPMSHGCVNMRTPDACSLFEWTSPPIAPGKNQANASQDNPGTKVVIHN